MNKIVYRKCIVVVYKFDSGCSVAVVGMRVREL